MQARDKVIFPGSPEVRVQPVFALFPRPNTAKVCSTSVFQLSEGAWNTRAKGSREKREGKRDVRRLVTLIHLAKRKVPRYREPGLTSLRSEEKVLPMFREWLAAVPKVVWSR